MSITIGIYFVGLITGWLLGYHRIPMRVKSSKVDKPTTMTEKIELLRETLDSGDYMFNHWEKDFIESVEKRVSLGGWVTEKQRAKIDSMYEGTPRRKIAT